MKKVQRIMLCGGVLATLMCTSSLAAEPGEIPLLVNGEEAVFPDAVPLFRGDTIDVPAVATFEALGFQITWDESSQTITAEKDGRSVTLVIGNETAFWSGPSWSEVSEDGKSATTGSSGGSVALSKPPYVDPATWRTYISAEDLDNLLPETFRVAVDYGWTADAAGGLALSTAEAAVVVDDVEAIWAANQETYELMDQYMEYAGQYNKGNWQVDGTLSLSFSDETSAAVGLGGEYSTITNETALLFDTDLAITLGELESGMQFVLPNVDIDVRYDVETGMFYFQSQALSGADTWFSMDMREIYDLAYGPGFYDEMVALSLASPDMTFAQTLEAMLRSDNMLPLSREVTTQDYLTICNGIFADSAFVQEGSTYTSTVDFFEEGAALQMRFDLFVSRGEVTGYSLEMRLDDETEGVSLVTEMRDEKMTMAFDMDIPGGTMNFHMDGTYRSVEAVPDAVPPAGAETVDLMEGLLGMEETSMSVRGPMSAF